MKDFKAFLLRGNLVDMAVGIVIGLAFGAVIAALVADIVTPLIAAIFGKPDFSQLSFTINGSRFDYGALPERADRIRARRDRLFFLVIKPVNALVAALAREPPADPTTRNCPECLSEIPLAANRCAFCTTEVARSPPRRSARYAAASATSASNRRRSSPASGCQSTPTVKRRSGASSASTCLRVARGRPRPVAEPGEALMVVRLDRRPRAPSSAGERGCPARSRRRARRTRPATPCARRARRRPAGAGRGRRRARR